MQPALNGIVAVSKPADWEKPWIGTRIAQRLLKGQAYYDVVADKDKSIVLIEDRTKFIFSRTCIRFDDGTDIVISSPPAEAMGIDTILDKLALVRGQRDRSGRNFVSGVHFKKGDPIFKGTLTSGDLVLVDKFSYHFRQPERGESFVFDTRGIDTNNKGDAFVSQQNATHYIKRLVAIPGDTVQIDAPHLLIDGARAKEEMIQRVAEKVRVSETEVFSGYSHPDPRQPYPDLLRAGTSKTLKSPEDRNYREFYAFGDNSPNSLDSRYWGSVKQHNLVGPALFSLWPFTSGHCGFIK